MTMLATDALTAAVESTGGALRRLDPALHRRYTDALPRAADAVARRLVAALHRERLGAVSTDRDALVVPGGRVAARQHGFDRAEPVGPLPASPLAILADLAGRLGATLAAELGSAVANLAIGYARRPTADPVHPDPDRQVLAFERLATEGHNLHPCGRTRLGWSVADVLRHDLEGAGTSVAFVRLHHTHGDDVGALLGRPGEHPVHTWQLDHLRRTRPDLVLDESGPRLAAYPTAALRTLHVPGNGYLKLSLDIQVTSTRRTISVASTRNGPALSGVLGPLLADEPVLLMAETAGAACVGAGADRDLGAIVRCGLSGRLAADETAVPAGALTATLPGTGRSVLSTILGAADPLAFVADYARTLLPPLLRLATRYGIGLEAHLQNCLPVFVAGRPRRIAIRDFAGLRVHTPRLAARGVALRLWPGSVVGTTDVDVMRSKLGYTALQAHLGELIRHLADTTGLDEPAAWRTVRSTVDEVYDGLRADPSTARDATADHAFWTAPTMPHKALVRMRLTGGGDGYVPVANPLRC